MKIESDILLVGAGFIGCVLAHALSQQGFKVVVVEKNPIHSQPSNSKLIQDNRSIVLTHSSYQILSALNIWPLLADSATPINTVQVTQAGHFGALRFTASDYQMPSLGYVVSAATLTAVLQQVMFNAPLVQFICPAVIKEIKIEKDKAQLQVDQEGQPVQLSAPLLVAADGGQSQIRQWCGISIKNSDYQQTAIIAVVTAEKDNQHIAYERFTKAGPIALLPRGGKNYGVIWTVANEQVKTILSWSDQTFLAEVQQQIGQQRVGKLMQVSPRQAYPLQLQIAEEQIQPCLILLGNAAHTLHPIAGQGFNLGLRDIAALTEILTAVKKEGQQALGDKAVLEKYVCARKRDQKNIIGFTDGIVRLFSHELLAQWSSLGFVAINNFPLVKRWLVHRLLGYSGNITKLSCGVPL